MNRKVFFDTIRGSIFGGKLNQRQVDGLSALLDAWAETGETDIRWLASIMGQVWLEVGRNMYPVREGFTDSDLAAIAHVTRLHHAGRISRNYALPDPGTGQSYFGRGQIQMTWIDNYRRAGGAMGLDLAHRPDLMLDPKISARVAVRGCISGWFREGHNCARYLNETTEDWAGARQIVNGDKLGGDLAYMSQLFYRALANAVASTGPTPKSKPKGNTIMGAILQSVIRHLMTAAAGFIVAQGWLDADAASQVSNLVMSVIGVLVGGAGLGWGIMDKNKVGY